MPARLTACHPRPQRLLGETAKIRYWTNQMTVLPWKSELEFARKELLVQVDETELLWKSLLHGNPEMDLTGSGERAPACRLLRARGGAPRRGRKPRRLAAHAVLDDPFQVEIIQGDMCLMEREEDCRDPSDPYHNQVSHGLGVVMGLYFSSARCGGPSRRAVVVVATRAAGEGRRRRSDCPPACRHWVAFEDSAPDDPVNYQDKDSSAQEFIWEVGSKEIADGIA